MTIYSSLALVIMQTAGCSLVNDSHRVFFRSTPRVGVEPKRRLKPQQTSKLQQAARPRSADVDVVGGTGAKANRSVVRSDAQPAAESAGSVVDGATAMPTSSSPSPLASKSATASQVVPRTNLMLDVQPDLVPSVAGIESAMRPLHTTLPRHELPSPTLTAPETVFDVADTAGISQQALTRRTKRFEPLENRIGPVLRTPTDQDLSAMPQVPPLPNEQREYSQAADSTERDVTERDVTERDITDRDVIERELLGDRGNGDIERLMAANDEYAGLDLSRHQHRDDFDPLVPMLIHALSSTTDTEIPQSMGRSSDDRELAVVTAPRQLPLDALQGLDLSNITNDISPLTPHLQTLLVAPTDGTLEAQLTTPVYIDDRGRAESLRGRDIPAWPQTAGVRLAAVPSEDSMLSVRNVPLRAADIRPFDPFTLPPTGPAESLGRDSTGSVSVSSTVGAASTSYISEPRPDRVMIDDVSEALHEMAPIVTADGSARKAANETATFWLDQRLSSYPSLVRESSDTRNGNGLGNKDTEDAELPPVVDRDSWQGRLAEPTEGLAPVVDGTYVRREFSDAKPKRNSSAASPSKIP